MALPQVNELDQNLFDRDYGDWTLEERELRAFLLATHRGMTGWFSEREAAANESVRGLDPETLVGDESFVAFLEDTGIFWTNYWERTASLVIKDAFRIYEVFLFESAHRVARRYGSGLLSHGTEDTWDFPTCVRFYRDYLGLEVLPPKLEAAKWIRNKLTHLADLNSSEGKAELATHKLTLGLDEDPSAVEKALGLFHEDTSWFFKERLRFTPLQTWRILDAIREQANVIGAAVHGYVWADATSTQALDDLARGVLVRPRRNTRQRGDEAYLVVPMP